MATGISNSPGMCHRDSAFASSQPSPINAATSNVPRSNRQRSMGEGGKKRTVPFVRSTLPSRSGKWGLSLFPPALEILSSRDGGCAAPALSQRLHREALARRSRPSSRVIGKLLLLPKEGRVRVGFPQNPAQTAESFRWFRNVKLKIADLKARIARWRCRIRRRPSICNCRVEIFCSQQFILTGWHFYNGPAIASRSISSFF